MVKPDKGLSFTNICLIKYGISFYMKTTYFYKKITIFSIISMLDETNYLG